MTPPHSGARIHPTAEIEDGVEIGAGHRDLVRCPHPRSGDARRRSTASSVSARTSATACRSVIGSKLNAFVYVCTGVTIETGVMIGAGTVFTNDRYPRATTPDLATLSPSEPDERTLPTLVAEGASIGAGCVIGCDLSIGRFALVGMGSVVTRSRATVPSRRRPAGPLGRRRVAGRASRSCGSRVPSRRIVRRSPAR